MRSQCSFMGQDRDRRTSEEFYPFFEAPSLPSRLIHPREGLHIYDDGVIWDLTVPGIWSLGSETSNSFCEGYRLFLALLVPVSSPSHGPRQGNEPLLPLPAACGSTSLFGMLGSQGMASPPSATVCPACLGRGRAARK